MNKLKVLLADDHPIFRKGLADIISAEKEFEIVAEAADGEDALAQIKKHKPDLIILDIKMPRLTGFEVVRELAKAKITQPVIFLTMHDEEDIFNHAIELGVKGYILKESAINEIVLCIKTVSKGKHYLSARFSDLFFSYKEKTESNLASGINKLTSVEKAIIKFIADKKTSQEIADTLFISVRTVENHRANICRKLELHGINALLKYAIENKHQF